MSGIFPIPGSWHRTWESPDATTEGLEAAAPVPTIVPLPSTQVPSCGTWNKPYNPFGFPENTLPEVLGDSTRFGAPSPTEASSTGGLLGIAEEYQLPIAIAVFGQTGTGKISFVQSVTGEYLPIGHSLTSCTDNVLPVPCRIGNKNVILVNTPGFSNTHLSSTEILRRIATWMKDAYNDGLLLSRIIYLHRITDNRLDGPSLKNLRMMKALCRTNTLRNVVLAITMWEEVAEEDGLRRETELKQFFWKDMIEYGSTVTRIKKENRTEARTLVKSLLKNRLMSTRLQEELQSGISLNRTGAGTEIEQELERLELKQRKEHKEEIADLKKAQLRRDLDLERQIRAEIAQNDHKIARLEAEKKELENYTVPKQLTRVKSKGLWGAARYYCLACKRETKRHGRWKCEGCYHEQRNIW